MVQMQGVYEGEKHCQVTHGPSKSTIETDAPKDNQGKGERFSPTDLVGAALGTCILTTMAMSAEKMGLDMKGSTFEVGKEMLTDPRRIGRLTVKLTLPASIPADKREFLEKIAHNCPVSKSLGAGVETPCEFIYR